jgi:hypothetical protein
MKESNKEFPPSEVGLACASHSGAADQKRPLEALFIKNYLGQKLGK